MGNNMEDYLLIIDGSSLLSTQFYGNLPREVLMGKTVADKEKFYHKIMQTSKGVYTNAVYGFLRALFSILENQKPTHLAITWDLTRETFRRKLYADYKANRSETVVPLSSQFALMQDILARMGVKQYMSNDYEADDFSGSLSVKFSKELPVRILTKDHDYLQLANGSTSIWLLQASQTKADELFAKYGMTKDKSCPDKCFPLTPELIRNEFGVKPTSVAALKGLMGDSSDNIKGVPGIGPVTAVSLIARYETVENLYAAIDENAADGGKALAESWKNELGIKRSPLGVLTKESDSELCGRKAAFLSEMLATIKTDLPIPEELADLKVSINLSETKTVLRELEITSVRLPDLSAVCEETVSFPKPERKELTDYGEVTAFFKSLSGVSLLGFDYDKAAQKAVFYDGKELTEIPVQFFVTEDLISESVKELQKNGTMISAIDVKMLLPMLSVSSDGTFDLALADYLLRPLTTEHGFKELANVYLSVLPDETPENKAVLSYLLHETLEKKLAAEGLTDLYRAIELPLIPVLYDMQQTGIRVNREELLAFGRSMEDSIAEEEETVYRLAGETFNILSPKQLGEILFTKLKLPYGRKTKTGYSTSADILEKLADEYEIVQHVLTYRQYTKLKSTYVDSLAGYISEDGRIHSNFNQMVTATGRLSSTEPNLQNIPIRTELGRLIRKVFIPKDGWKFVDADYSQIELRLLAHMSGDESLIDAFNNGRDIHRATAAKVFGKTYDEVTSSERSAAKAVNFGIIYGISSFGLGQGLNISRAQASEYIDSYFVEYPKIKAFLDGLVAKAKKEECARSVYGRIRPIPELSSDNFMTRQFGERVAMNMPIQGTAADIMKLAMLRTDRLLKEHGLNSRILVQVHDELLIETDPAEEDEVKTVLKEAMEGVADFKVPLSIGIAEGSTWYEAK